MNEVTTKKAYEKPQLTVEELSLALYTANEQLRVANLHLMQIDEARVKMFTNISHDLRAPITAIRSSVEYLNSCHPISQAELTQILKIIEQRTMTLEQLINDIFLLASLEGTHNPLSLKAIDIGILLEDYFFSAQTNSLYKERILTLDVPSDFRILLQVDPDKIVRVLDNLFVNALKYSEPGDAISLSVTLEDTAVLIHVTDTGIGIPTEELSKIFAPAYTVSSSRTPNQASSHGLGLSIAKSIVELHQGRIWCESVLGEGSTFSFTLPRESTT